MKDPSTDDKMTKSSPKQDGLSRPRRALTDTVNYFSQSLADTASFLYSTAPEASPELEVGPEHEQDLHRQPSSDQLTTYEKIPKHSVSSDRLCSGHVDVSRGTH